MNALGITETSFHKIRRAQTHSTNIQSFGLSGDNRLNETTLYIHTIKQDLLSLGNYLHKGYRTQSVLSTSPIDNIAGWLSSVGYKDSSTLIWRRCVNGVGSGVGKGGPGWAPGTSLLGRGRGATCASLLR